MATNDDEKGIRQRLARLYARRKGIDIHKVLTVFDAIFEDDVTEGLEEIAEEAPTGCTGQVAGVTPAIGGVAHRKKKAD